MDVWLGLDALLRGVVGLSRVLVGIFDDLAGAGDGAGFLVKPRGHYCVKIRHPPEKVSKIFYQVIVYELLQHAAVYKIFYNIHNLCNICIHVCFKTTVEFFFWKGIQASHFRMNF